MAFQRYNLTTVREKSPYRLPVGIDASGERQRNKIVYTNADHPATNAHCGSFEIQQNAPEPALISIEDQR
ncbi:hypothetical protein NS183_05345 [Microbacterium testaceum]|nr:hypothetical protein NS183_05345 [Microbacterium testaceum]